MVGLVEVKGECEERVKWLKYEACLRAEVHKLSLFRNVSCYLERSADCRIANDTIQGRHTRQPMRS